MPKKKLKELISPLQGFELAGSSNTFITSISYDSREIQKNGLFFALKGIHVDGHNFIDKALDAGAAAIVHSDPISIRRDGITYIRVENTRAALSPVSAAFWDYPSREMTVVGVTGTDGKSTTVGLIRQLLKLNGVSTGSLSTVEFCIGGQSDNNPLRQSTPEAPQIHRLLHYMRKAGQHCAILEATSHGLSPRNNRLADVDFDVAVFTNVTSEHLEFHGDLETYRSDKARLFQMIAENDNPAAFGVVNADDPHAGRFITAAKGKKVFTYSLTHPDANLFASNLRCHPSGTEFSLNQAECRIDVRLNLPGIFNVENLLAALCVVSNITGRSPADFAELCPKLTGIRGRMEPVEGNMDFHVLVDYAHSPGSFSKVLPFLKTLTPGRLILLFGSAGERDLEKRPEQGRIASEYGDILILTDEDPRGEEPQAILEDIARGVQGMRRGRELFLIPDRREAIATAFKMAKTNDLVATLGKGHEASMIYTAGPRPWNEIDVCKEVLTELGYVVRRSSGS